MKLRTRVIKKILLLFLLTIFLMGCEELSLSENKDSKVNNTLSTDKELKVKIDLSTNKGLYHSNEKVTILVNIESNKEVLAKLKVYGIYSRTNRLDKTQAIHLKPGANDVTIYYTTPRCTGCAGIKPGTYQINAELIYINATLANTSKNIEIRQ